MTVICPTITADNPKDYSQQLSRIRGFATRVHIDLADTQFTPRQLISPGQVHFPAELTTDLHIMVADPVAHLMTLISLQPHLVIVHSEAKGDLKSFLRHLQQVDIKAGIALLPDTSVKETKELIALADHVLIFAGHLGYQGGEADMSQLAKVTEIRAIKPSIEIGWDGGASSANAHELSQGGVDVLNVGGFIQNAINPQQAYQNIIEQL